MENPTPGVTPASERKPEEIEREMEQTRESITEKVSALETQVMGTIQTATDTVTGTVDAVKETIAAAPSAVKDTVKETFAAVKDSVKATVGSFSVSECTRDHPWAAVGSSAAAGFLTGFFLFGGNRGGGVFGRPIMARGDDTPAPGGRVGGVHTPHQAAQEPASSGFRMPGFLDDLFGMLGKELREAAQVALASASAALKQSISAQVPKVVDTAVHRVTDRVNGPTEGDGSTRVNGPNYAARG